MERDFSRIWRGFWQLADPKVWVASTIPMVLGAALAYSFHRVFNLYWFSWNLLGIYLIEIGKNAVNEFVDYETGADVFVSSDKRTPFSGGKKTIVDGVLTVRETKLIALGTMSIAAIIGFYIAFFREHGILWIGILGFLLSILYSLPPFKFCYRGLGEFIVGLCFGPLTLIGTYLVQVKTIKAEVLLASLVLGFLISNVLWINQYPDFEADVLANKRNWVVRLGKRRGIAVYVMLYVMAYLSVLLLGLASKNPLWFLAFLSIPMAKRSVDVAKKHYDDIPRLVEANAKTIKVYQVTGLALTVAAFVNMII